MTGGPQSFNDGDQQSMIALFVKTEQFSMVESSPKAEYGGKEDTIIYRSNQEQCRNGVTNWELVSVSRNSEIRIRCAPRTSASKFPGSSRFGIDISSKAAATVNYASEGTSINTHPAPMFTCVYICHCGRKSHLSLFCALDRALLIQSVSI